LKSCIRRPTPAIVFRALTHRPHCLFLDSARGIRNWGAISFITADPFDWVCASADEPGDSINWQNDLVRIKVRPLRTCRRFKGARQAFSVTIWADN